MKYIFLYIVIILIVPFQIISQTNDIELGVRYLKLGNTYLKANDFELSEKYLLKGLNKVKGQNKYWEAVAYEYLGYYYLDALGNTEKAIEYLNKAQLLYQQVVGQKEGSQDALESVLDQIQYLNNNMYSIPNDSISSSKKINKRKLLSKTGSEILNYDNQKLRDLPNDIPSNIKNISLAENKFRDFPNELINFKGIEYLNLQNNKIKSLPENIGSMQNLKYLNLADNKLKHLPESLCDMKNLKMIDLKGNKISFEDISNLIRCLPNTNILFDEYILKPQKGPEDELPEEEEQL